MPEPCLGMTCAGTHDFAWIESQRALCGFGEESQEELAKQSTAEVNQWGFSCFEYQNPQKCHSFLHRKHSDTQVSSAFDVRLDRKATALLHSPRKLHNHLDFFDKN